METLLDQLITTLHEPAIETLCQKYYNKLFIENHCMVASIPLDILTQLQREVDQLDNTLLTRMVEVINQLSVLLVLLQMLDQNKPKARDLGIFRDVIENFRVLCQQKEVVDGAVLVFIVILHTQMQKRECFLAQIYGDNIAYGIAALLQLMNLVGE